MSRHRTDLLSESIDKMPRGRRGLMRFQVGLLKFFRVFIALQAVGGFVRFLIAVATLDGKLALGALAQMLFAALLFGLNFGSEEVLEAKGSHGAFVIRAGSRRLWKDERGIRKLSKLVMGDRVWAVTVRRRADDPFGPIVARHTRETQREANAEAKALVDRIRKGEDITAPV
jgi:hypothetical protein